MIVTPLRTEPIGVRTYSMTQLLDKFLPSLEENQILVVTSKIVALCEGKAVPVGSVDKEILIQREADYYLPKELNKYGFHLSVKGHTLIASAGIDESNGDGNYVLWPSNLQESANQIREYLCHRFQITHVGVVITDSHIFPLRWGTLGTALVHSGFLAYNDYRGKPDVFGRLLRVTRANISEALAAAAVLVMGEGNEQTPLATVAEIPFITFQERNPTPEELEELHINLEDDVYGTLLTSVPWKKGGGQGEVSNNEPSIFKT